MIYRSATIAACAALILSVPAAAGVVNGTGTSPIVKDVTVTRSAAELEARRDLVRALISQSIGSERVREFSVGMIDDLARQIRDDMIIDQKSAREGALFRVTLTADVDQAWFTTRLEDLGISSAQQRAAAGATILVMLDSSTGEVPDFNRPAEESVTYDRRTGASYSDHSAEATSEKSAYGTSSKSAVGVSSSSRGAYGVSTPYGSAAGAERNRASGAALSKSSSAGIHKYSNARKNRVDAEVHDDVSYSHHTVWRRPAQNSDAGLIMSALSGDLNGYGVAMSDSAPALTSFFGDKVPRLSALTADARFPAFLSRISTGSARYFMGGTLTVEMSTDVATQQTRCSGSLDAKAFSATAGNNEIIGSGTAAGEAVGRGPAACRAKLAETLSLATAAKMGPQIQRYWRQQDRVRVAANQSIDTKMATDYSLTLRSARLTMAMQADILDALQSTPGVNRQGFISQVGNEMRFSVNYAGSIPLQLALYQKLRGNPAFAGMESTAQGRSVLLCLSGCGQK